MAQIIAVDDIQRLQCYTVSFPAETLADIETARINAAKQKQARVKIGVFIVVVTVSIIVLTQIPLMTYLLDTFQWVKDHTFAGPFVVILVFCIGIPLYIPSTLLEMTTGYLFGVFHGVIVIAIGKPIGSLIAFFFARYLGTKAIGDYLAQNFPTFRAFAQVLNGATWKPLLLLQLSTIPNIIKVYAIAITNVSPFRFVISLTVGGFPNSILWAYLGDQANDIASILSGQTQLTETRLLFLLGGSVLTALMLTLLVLYTRRQLHDLRKRERASGIEEDYLLDVDPLAVLHSTTSELTRTQSGSFTIR